MKVRAAVFTDQNPEQPNSFVIPGYITGYPGEEEGGEETLRVGARIVAAAIRCTVEWREFDYDEHTNSISYGVVRKARVSHYALRDEHLDILVIAGPLWDSAPYDPDIRVVETDGTEVIHKRN